jgi:outer membrane protein insertion porin family
MPLTGCKQTKYVPDGKYLLKKNTIAVNKAELTSDELLEIVRQKPNYKTFGMKIKLAAYNAVDSTKVADKRIRKNEQIKIKNQKRKVKEERINTKRIERAKRRGKEWYTHKTIPLKDTVDPRMFFREWLKYKFGESPVIFDSMYYEKSLEQLQVFLRKKGYYYGTVKGDVTYNDKKKAVVKYTVNTGKRYYIDSVYLKTDNESVKNSYLQFLKRGKIESLKNRPLDSDMLDAHRSNVAEQMRNDAYYGFNFSSIDYIADTTVGNYKVHLGVRIGDRMVQSTDHPDSILHIPYRSYLVKDVYFHLQDTILMKGNYKKRLDELNLQPTTAGQMTLIDTLFFQKVKFNRSEKKRRNIPLDIDSLNPQRMAYFYYNGKPFVKPGVIELQNYLERDNYYKQYYQDRSYSRLLQLDVFSSIKPKLVEIQGTNYVDVHYYLVPAKKQYFSFEPKFTNSNGFLGIAASLNYSSKNLFRGAEKLTFSLGGGLESQPPIFNENKVKTAERSFNTFEFEPGVKLELPGLFPLRRAAFTAKRQRAKTILSASFNYQNRQDFERKSFQFSYLWKFYGDETQIFSVGLPTSSVVKYVNINPRGDFEDKLNQLNDAFLKNTYSNQFIWQDWKIVYEYNNSEKKYKKGKANVYYKLSFDPAGNFISLFKKFQKVNDEGQYKILGERYAQFVRLDNEIIYAQPFNKKHSFNMRFLVGGGVPYGNSPTSLPYDYSFSGGGANDNRGWRARTLGPGVYKAYLDPNKTITQVGDVRLGIFAEYRFTMSGMFKGAVFADVGNVWTYKEDINRPGAQITKDFYKQLTVSTGFGLRMDLDFFVIRLDLGLPLFNPAYPTGSQWLFQSRSAYRTEVENAGLDYKKLGRPFKPLLHFGIGYPF